jgi:hypothetical protein
MELHDAIRRIYEIQEYFKKTVSLKKELENLISQKVFLEDGTYIVQVDSEFFVATLEDGLIENVTKAKLISLASSAGIPTP